MKYILQKPMLFEIGENILAQFPEKKLKVFFYTAGCEWWKIDITSDFDTDGLEYFSYLWKEIYYTKEDTEKLEGGKILLKPAKKSEEFSKHAPTKYMFLSPKVESRCGCATSVAFEKKLLPSVKLKNLRKIFKGTLEKK